MMKMSVIPVHKDDIFAPTPGLSLATDKVLQQMNINSVDVVIPPHSLAPGVTKLVKKLCGLASTGTNQEGSNSASRAATEYLR
jgi:hypothetical protein